MCLSPYELLSLLFIWAMKRTSKEEEEEEKEEEEGNIFT